MLIDKGSTFRDYVHILSDLGCQDYRKPVITDWFLSKVDRIHNGFCIFCKTCDII